MTSLLKIFNLGPISEEKIPNLGPLQQQQHTNENFSAVPSLVQ